MFARLLVSVVLLCGIRHAAADRPLDIQLAPGAPFDVSQLAAAIRLRLPSVGARVSVRVTPATDGVHVETSGGARDVATGGLSGEAAARLVALAIDDLVLDDLARPAPRLEVRPAAHGSVALLGTVDVWDRTMRGGTLAVSVPRGRWLAGLDVSVAQPVVGAIGVLTTAARATVGIHASVFDVRAGVTTSRIGVHPMMGGLDGSTTLVGGAATARVRVPVARHFELLYAAGVDAFANRAQFVLAGAAVFTTPRVGMWFGAGLEGSL